METRNENENRIPHQRKTIFILILLCFAIVAILLSLRLRAPEQSAICGIDTSNLLLKDAQQLLEEQVERYAQRVTVGDQCFDLTADDIGLVFLDEDFKTVVKEMRSTGSSADPWSVLSIDDKKLVSYCTEHFDQRVTTDVPASAVWDDMDCHFKVLPGSPQTWYDAHVLADLVKNAVANLSSELDVPLQELYMEMHDDEQLAEIEQLVDEANTLLELKLEYAFRPRQVELGCEVLVENMIASFLRFDYENNVVYADENAVATYVKSIAPGYTYSKNKDRFITHGGDRVDVQITFQEQKVDTQALTGMIVESINNGVSGTCEVPYTGAVNFDGNYIEVSIPEQHLWVYQDGVVVLESDVVTGNQARNKRTPRGLNMVRGHLKSIYLIDDYFVDYWMKISMDGTYGFHDADRWRKPEEYGGDTYKTNGSGGCVNVPLENMAKMYEMVPDYTPVVIYDEYFYD